MMIAGLYCWKKTSPLFANLGYESSCWSYQGYINRYQTTLYAEKEWIGRYGESFFPHLLIACKVRNFLLLASGKRRKKMLKPDCKLCLARFGEFTKPAVCTFMGEMQLIFFIFFPPCFHRFSTGYLIVFHHAFGGECSICTWIHTPMQKRRSLWTAFSASLLCSVHVLQNYFVHHTINNHYIRSGLYGYCIVAGCSFEQLH